MKYRILVVEDEAGHRNLLERTLKRAGFEVLLAVDGAQGKEMLQKNAVDLVVSDWNMPKLNGGQLASWIRKTENLGRLPILMLTVRAKAEEEALGFASGVDDYLQKPYSTAELTARIGRLLSLRSR